MPCCLFARAAEAEKGGRRLPQAHCCCRRSARSLGVRNQWREKEGYKDRLSFRGRAKWQEGNLKKPATTIRRGAREKRNQAKASKGNDVSDGKGRDHIPEPFTL